MESLYRKYRPQTFDDVVGQAHVVETLEHAVLEGRTSHAYLFCGPRGTGKTTMARLLAKALMCEQGPGHLPDGTCEQCRLIAEGEHPDVLELDAASRTGVDNVREEIINRVNYAPARGRYKVYIIDEVHMLTTAAFNALLKTLEEPPSHVVFVLCTTDPQKIPATILSRVQRFDFHAIGTDDMLARLVHVCQQEGFSYDDAALDLVVRHARGGMRDALSTLEQLSVFGDGEVSLAAAQDLLGEVPGSSLRAVSQALAARDVGALFGEVARLVDSGRDLLQFTRELAAHMRDVYVVAAVGAKPGVVQATEDDLEAIAAEASSFGSSDRVARILSILGDASGEMRTAANQRLVLEIALTRMARPESDLTLEALAERVDELARQVAALSRPGVARPSSAPISSASGESAKERHPRQEATQRQGQAPVQTRDAGGATPGAAAPRPEQAPPRTAHSSQKAPAQRAGAAPPQGASPAGRPTVDEGRLQRAWKQVVDTLMSTSASRGSLLMSSTIVSDDGATITVSLPAGSGFALRMLERSDVRTMVDSVVSQVFGPRRVTFGEGLAQGTGASRPTRKPRAKADARGKQRPKAAAQPSPEVPEPASRPAATPAPASADPAPRKSGPRPTTYEMPWDEPRRTAQAQASQPEEPPYEAVPYDDASAASFDEDPSGYASEAPSLAPVEQKKKPEAEESPSAKPAPDPVAPQAAPAGTPSHSIPDDVPEDLIAIVESAFDVFGDGVKISKA